MPHQVTDPSGPASALMAILVLLSVLYLGYRHWRDLRDRPPVRSSRDIRHFLFQDLRRGLGTLALLILSLALFAGSRTPERIEGHANLNFIRLWSGILFLLVVLVSLATMDWFATRAYALRHRQELTREGLSIIEAELRVRLEMHRKR